MRMTTIAIATTVVVLLVGGIISDEATAQPLPVRAEVEADGVAVYVDGALFTRYKTVSEQKYPYFYPVNGPVSGESVTTESSEPYPHHHSLFFGCDRVNGGNYWQDSNDRGQIVSQGVTVEENPDGNSVTITDNCLWQRPGQDPVIADSRTMRISAPGPELRVIDFGITLKALTDVRIQKTNHSLFSARMMPGLSVENGGQLVNSEGDSEESGTFGVAAPWCDYSGTRDGVTEGLAILQSPSNRWFPSPWFTRDYGFFSPTPMYWLEGDEFTMSMGETLMLNYRVIVHGGDAKSADIAALYEEYATNSAEN